jgi:hypothetical protein
VSESAETPVAPGKMARNDGFSASRGGRGVCQPRQRCRLTSISLSEVQGDKNDGAIIACAIYSGEAAKQAQEPHLDDLVHVEASTASGPLWMPRLGSLWVIAAGKISTTTISTVSGLLP